MSTILVLVVVAVIGYFILSANGVKLFKKKEHKVKAKKSNEEKYEEVLPKEKKEKKSVKISDDAKKEKLKDDIKKELNDKALDKTKSTAVSKGTVSKITKEDFMKNNIEVPTTSNLLSDEEKKAMTAKTLPKAKEQPSKPYDFGFPDFSDGPGGLLDDSMSSKDDPFADIDFDAILNNSSSPKFGADNPLLSEGLSDFGDKDSGFGDLDFPSVQNEFKQKPSVDYFNSSPSFNMGAQSSFGNEPILSQSLDERFEQVFGENYAQMGGSKMGKEVIIGDILKGPRARENRARRTERERRNKWM